jgi:hypothetical protein
MMFRALSVVFLLVCGVASALNAQDALPAAAVTVRDEQGAAIVGAVVTVVKSDGSITKSAKAADGSARFESLVNGAYSVRIEADGFEPFSSTLDITANHDASLEAVLKVAAAHTQSVTVEDTEPAPLDRGPSPPVELKRESVKNLPGRPATVADALPLSPGIIRMPDGTLRLSGSGEHRSALLVNSSDATDPSTGQFGATVPIDSVQTVNVMASPFLAEYGRFTSTVIAVETRRAGDKWHFEINDPLPEFRWRSWHMVGLRSSTPRLNFGGPLIKNRLHVLESIQYEMRSVPVITLPFPDNQQRKEGYNSLTAIDYVINQSNALTASIHVADNHTRYANMDFFNPEPVTPNDAAASFTADVTEHAVIGGTLLDSSLTASRFHTAVWPQGFLPMTLAPVGNSGNYFSTQTRASSREEWRETWSLTRNFAGVHNLKFGSTLAGAAEHAQVEQNPVNIVDPFGALLQNISFTAGQPIHRSDIEFGMFAQDQWTIGTRFALSAGIRADQQEITETFRVAPRLGFVWTPLRNARTVIRGGAGVFYDRVPLNVYGFSSYPQRIITTYAPDGSIASGPTLFYNVTEQAAHSDLPLIYRNALLPGNFAPYSTNANIQVEQILTPNLRLRAGYLQSRSDGLIVLTSHTTPVNALMLTGSGNADVKQFDVTAAARAGRESELFFSYVRGHSTGNLNEFSNYLADFPPAVVLPDSRASLPGDMPNRFLAWGTISLPDKFRIMPKAEYHTGAPWSSLDVMQNYAGAPNSQRFPSYLSLDARISKDFKVNDKYSVRFAVSGSNLTNHFNPVSIHSNIADPVYGVFFGEYRRRYTADFDVLF